MERLPKDTQQVIFLFLFLGWKNAKSKHLKLSFKSHFKHLILKVAVWLQWYRVGSVTSCERVFWFEYSQIIFLFLWFFFYSLQEKFWVACFLLNALLNILIFYLMFIFKQNNLYKNEHALTAWFIVFTHILYIILFF